MITNHNIDLEHDCIFRKPTKRRLQRYIVRTKILSTLHVRVEYISVPKYAILPSHTNGRKIPKQPLSLGARGPSSNTPVPRPTQLTIPNGIRIHSAVLPQYTFRTDRPTDRPTHRRTDGSGDRSVRLSRTLAILIESDALIIVGGLSYRTAARTTE